MKSILTFGLFLLFVSCSSVKNNKDIIPYLIDLSAEKSIYEEIKKSSDQNIVFFVEHLPDSTLKFYMISSIDKELLKTNRKLFINNKFYPLLFDTDNFFSTRMKNSVPIVSFEFEKNSYKEIPIPTIEEREKNPELFGYKKTRIIIDNSIYWIVDKKGKLIKSN